MSSPSNTPWPSVPQANRTMGNVNSTILADGGSSVASSKEKDQDVDSSASPLLTNISSPGSQYPTSSTLHAASPISRAIQNQPPVRAESLLALQRIQKARDNTDSASDNETEQGPRKRARREQPVDDQEHFRIGYYKNEPTLPLYASIGASNKLIVQAFKKHAPPKALENWNTLFPHNRQVGWGKTVLDNDIFSLSTGELEDIDSKKMHRMLKEYVEAKKADREKRHEALSKKSQEIHIGSYKADTRVEVYASILKKANGIPYPTFHIRTADPGKGPLGFKAKMISYKDVKYANRYVRKNFDESRKAVEEDLAKIPQSTASPVQPECALQLSGTMLEQESGATGATGPENEDHGLGVKFRNNLMRTLQDKGSAVENHAKKLAESVSEFVGLAASQEKLAFDTGVEVKKLREDNREQAQEIANLRAALSQMQAQMAAQQAHQPAHHLRSIGIEHGLLESIPSEVGSPGMLATPERAARIVELGDKKYKERIFLLECELQYTGQATDEIIQREGLSFRRREEKIVDGTVERTVEKFVQILDPSSLVQSEGRQFVKWVTLKEPQKKSYHGI